MTLNEGMICPECEVRAVGKGCAICDYCATKKQLRACTEQLTARDETIKGLQEEITTLRIQLERKGMHE